MIDNEPELIHPHCLDGCAMHRKDATNQCGDGCVLTVIYGHQESVVNPRALKAELVEIVYGDNPMIKAVMDKRKKRRKWRHGKRGK